MDYRVTICFLVVLVAVRAHLNRTLSDHLNEIPDEMEPKIFNGRDAEKGEFPFVHLNRTLSDHLNEIPDEMEPKIVNGRDAEEGEFPFVVALHYQGRFICTAFLIAEDLVMTAAHCVELRDNGAEPATEFYGIAGSIRRSSNETRIDFREVITHPDYATSGGEEGDIAIFRTTQPVRISDRIRPICLSAAGRDFEKQDVTAVGWGVTSTTSRDPPEILQTTELRVFSKLNCRIFFAFLGIRITDAHVCVNSKRDTGVCFGDSGGPLVYRDPSGQRISIGIAAFITPFGCGRRSVPNVYTSVSHYNDWIQTTVGENSGVCYV